MRMWGVNPKLLCKKHLLGEHVEMHMAFGCLGKNIMKGFNKGLVDFSKLEVRHNALVKEMENRGYKHNTPLVMFQTDFESEKIDINHSLKELSIRCKECRKLMEKYNVIY